MDDNQQTLSTADIVFSFGVRQWKLCQGSTQPVHPFDQPYEPDLIFRYPEANGSSKDVLSDKTWMFCYPLCKCQLVKASPQEEQVQYHGFVITDEVGLKHHTMCATFYERLSSLSEQVQAQYRQSAEQWKFSNVSANEEEYITHVKDRIDETEKLLLSCNDDERTIYTEKLAILKVQYAPFTGLFTDFGDIMVPRCFGVISKYPFYGFFKDWISCVMSDAQTKPISIERYIMNLLFEVPLPPPGKVDVHLMMGRNLLSLSRPPLNSVATIKNFSFTPILACLGLNNFVRLLEFVAAERKILFVSSRASILSLACETITMMMYPLYWQHIYIPVLPANLIQYVHAPVPYIIGILSSYQTFDRPPSDVLIADLDEGSLTYYKSEVSKNQIGYVASRPEAAFLPSKERSKLLARLRSNCKVTETHKPSLLEWDNYLTNQPWSSYDVHLVQQVKQKLAILEKPLKAHYDILIQCLKDMPVPINNELPSNSSQYHHLKNPSVSVEAPESSTSQESATVQNSEVGRRHRVRRKQVQYDKDLPVPPIVAGSVSSLHVTTTSALSDSSSLNSYEASISTTLDNAKPNAGAYLSQQLSPIQDESDEFTDSQSPLKSSSRSVFMKQFSDMFYTSGTQARVQLNSIGTSASDKARRGSKSTSEHNGRQITSINSWIKNVSLTDVVMNADHLKNQQEFVAIKEQSNHAEDKKFVNIHHSNKLTSQSGLIDMRQIAPRLLLVTPFQSHRSPSSFADYTHQLKETYVGILGQISQERLNSLPSFSVGVCMSCLEPLHVPFVLLNSIGSGKHGLVYVHNLQSNLQLERTSEVLQCSLCDTLVHKSCVDHLQCVCQNAVDEVKVQEAFVRLWSSLLRNYKAILDQPIDQKMDEFKRQGMLTSMTEGDSNEFMNQILESQAFSQFLDERRDATGLKDYDVLLFDECIKAKLNRQKFRLSVESTPFLEDKTFAHSTIYQCSRPDLELALVRESQSLVCYNLPDRALDMQLMIPPKRIKRLVSEKDSQRLKIYTHSILRRARIERLVNTPDIGGWMRDRLRPLLSSNNVIEQAGDQTQPQSLQRASKQRSKIHEDRQLKANINLTLDEIQNFLIKLSEVVDTYPRKASDEDQVSQVLQTSDKDQLCKYKADLQALLSQIPKSLSQRSKQSAEESDAQMLLRQIEQRLQIYEDQQQARNLDK